MSILIISSLFIFIWHLAHFFYSNLLFHSPFFKYNISEIDSLAAFKISNTTNIFIFFHSITLIVLSIIDKKIKPPTFISFISISTLALIDVFIIKHYFLMISSAKYYQFFLLTVSIIYLIGLYRENASVFFCTLLFLLLLLNFHETYPSNNILFINSYFDIGRYPKFNNYTMFLFHNDASIVLTLLLFRILFLDSTQIREEENYLFYSFSTIILTILMFIFQMMQNPNFNSFSSVLRWSIPIDISLSILTAFVRPAYHLRDFQAPKNSLICLSITIIFLIFFYSTPTIIHSSNRLNSLNKNSIFIQSKYNSSFAFYRKSIYDKKIDAKMFFMTIMICVIPLLYQNIRIWVV